MPGASLLSRPPPERHANVPEGPRHSRAFHLLDSPPAGMTVSAMKTAAFRCTFLPRLSQHGCAAGSKIFVANHVAFI
jgi:hypothetical protein